jgi:hypothetical protein
MTYLVFDQSRDVIPDEHRLITTARAHFGAELAFPRRHVLGIPPATAELGVTVTVGKRPAFTLEVRIRRATEEDHRAADRAEQLGRAGGMATLARRCAVVWEITAGTATEGELVLFTAMLAATVLGPVLPPDGSTLFGVRGARERAERLLGSSDDT